MNIKSKLLFISVSLILSFAFAGCGNKNNTESESNPSSDSETQTSYQNDESESQEDLDIYKETIEKYKEFITAVSEDKLADDERWNEQPWANLGAYFQYLKNEEKRDIKKEACYALKDLNNDGKPDLILLSSDYTIHAIYTLFHRETPILVDSYWERNKGFLIPDFDEDQIGICSHSSNSAFSQEMNLSTLLIDSDWSGSFDSQDPLLLVREKYIRNENKYNQEYNTHCFYSNVKIDDNIEQAITEQDFTAAIEKYATTEQTKKVGLELKPLFED